VDISTDIRYPGYDFVPVTDNGYRFGYVIKIAGTDIQRCYPRIVYPLPCVRLPCGPVTASAAGHTSDGPLLIQPYPPHGARAVAPRMRPHLRGCQRARFRFRWGPHPTPPHPSRWRHIFFAPLLVRSSPPPKLQSRAEQRPHTELEKAAMATQALLSGRPVQSSVARSSSSRKAPFIVRASSSPPAKVPARRQLGAALLQTYSRTQLTDRFDLQQGADRQLWFASKQSLSYLDGT
jgi:hypothetical protein